MSAFPWVCGIVQKSASGVIGTPVSLGGATGTATNSTVVLTIGASIPAGALVFVGILGGQTTSISVNSVADSAGNTYSLAKSAGYGTNNTVEELWYSANVAAVSNSTSMTATFSQGTLAGSNVPIIVAGYATGITSAPLDKTASTRYEPDTAYSSGATATLSQAKELAIGFAAGYTAGAATVVTEGTGFTVVKDQQQAAGNQWFGHLAYQIVAATTALNYQPTLSVTAYGGSIISTFKGS